MNSLPVQNYLNLAIRSASFVSANPTPTTTSTLKISLKKVKRSSTKNEQNTEYNELLEENQSEEDGSKNNKKDKSGEKPVVVKMKPRYMHQSYTIYTNVLLRVTSTCGEYLDLKKEKRRAITDKSRLFYVKREIDFLDPLDEEKFKTYIEAYREIVYRTKRPKHPEKITENSASTPTDSAADESNTKTKKDGTPMYITDTTKKTVRQFLMIHDEFGQLLHRLIMDFLNPDNLDYQDYLAQQKKDKSIKQACKNRSKAASRTILALTMSLDRTRKHYANIFVKKPTKDLSK